MGPIACFDKSFLQSLSIDESVWFDQYFSALITPLFFIETLGDLEKEIEGRSPEDEVRRIAEKTPEVSGNPNVFHSTISKRELRGYMTPMSHVPVLAGAKPASHGGKQGFVFEVSPEMQAWERWRKGDFLEIERAYAKVWRESVNAGGSPVGDDFLARSIVDDPSSPYEKMKFVFDIAGVLEGRDRIFHLHRAHGFPPLRNLAPYTAHVMDVEIFCRIAQKKGLISAERPSNRVDIAYLNYLPFCQVFISSDKLHRRTVPLFLKPGQEFIWGPDLKADLRRINEHLLQTPEEIREQGIMSFASRPPTDGDFFTSRVWDRILPKWRDSKKPALESDIIPETLREMFKGMKESASRRDTRGPENFQDADAVFIERRVHRKKGSWYQIPKSCP